MEKREIKFRAKRLDNGEWDYGYLFQSNTDNGTPYAFLLKDSRYAVDDNPQNYDQAVLFFREEVAVIDDETIGQFTGLYDKNGKEIYEGDIVREREVGGYEIENIGIVRYYKEDCRFGIDISSMKKYSSRHSFAYGEQSFNDGYCTVKFYYEYEITGNIFDNSDLIEETK